MAISHALSNFKNNSSSKIYKLNKNSEFKYIYSHGKFVSSYNLTTYCVKRRQKNQRIGITTSKKIGCAVKRNRARRLIFESYMKIYKNLDKNCNLVFLARVKTCESDLHSVLKSMIFQTKKLGIWISRVQ